MLLIFSVPVKLPIYFLRDNGTRGKEDRKALLNFTSNPPLAEEECRSLRTSRAMKCFLYPLSSYPFSFLFHG